MSSQKTVATPATDFPPETISQTRSMSQLHDDAADVMLKYQQHSHIFEIKLDARALVCFSLYLPPLTDV